jgi:hypothetical protein
MEKQSNDQNSIQAHLYSLLIPQEILLSSEVDSITEKEEDLFMSYNLIYLKNQSLNRTTTLYEVNSVCQVI